MMVKTTLLKLITLFNLTSAFAKMFEIFFRYNPPKTIGRYDYLPHHLYSIHLLLNYYLGYRPQNWPRQFELDYDAPEKDALITVGVLHDPEHVFAAYKI